MNMEDTTRYRVSQLEIMVKELNEKVEKLLTNHIPHINESIIQLNTKVSVLAAINIGSLILAAVVQWLLKF